MKLRILNNSVRLRLSKSEVQNLIQKPSIEAKTNFPSGESLRYRLEKGDSEEVSFSNNELVVRIDTHETEAWCKSEKVGIRKSFESKTGPLIVLIEKDFQCLVGDEKIDQSDQFAHPAPIK